MCPQINRSTSSSFSFGGPEQTVALAIKQKHHEQLRSFRDWAKAGDWDTFKAAHYDWWMFPIDRDSAGQGSRYTATEPVRDVLLADAQFMKEYKEGVALYFLSQGWDITQDPPKLEAKRWHDYPVRFGKVLASLKLFGEKELHKKAAFCVEQHYGDKVRHLERWVQEALAPGG